MCINLEVSEQSDKKEDVQNELYMAGGHMTLSQLEALLNAIPMEITFVDEDNINRYFNEGSKVFKRPVMAIDRRYSRATHQRLRQRSEEL